MHMPTLGRRGQAPPIWAIAQRHNRASSTPPLPQAVASRHENLRSAGRKSGASNPGNVARLPSGWHAG